MRYLEFLRQLHVRLAPRTYLEIGVRHGDSLALSRCRSLGIDPAYTVQSELSCQVSLFRTTSDEFFAATDPRRHLGGRPVDLSFVDGMHLFEFALRDFINVERATAWTSVVVFDDMFPRNVDEAARNRHTQAWTGDVYKVMATLRRHRPDLILLPVNTRPTGLLLVLGPGGGSDALERCYDEILAEHVVADPQPVPGALLRRDGALAPKAVLAAPLWRQLRLARLARIPRGQGMPRLLRSLNASFPALPLPSGRGGTQPPAQSRHPVTVA